MAYTAPNYYSLECIVYIVPIPLELQTLLFVFLKATATLTFVSFIALYMYEP